MDNFHFVITQSWHAIQHVFKYIYIVKNSISMRMLFTKGEKKRREEMMF